MSGADGLPTIAANHSNGRTAMTTVFIARRDALRARQAQAQLETSRELRVLGVADSLYRAQAALPGLDPDTLLIDLRLEDGAALSLVRRLRERHAERPKVMLMATDAADPLLFSTLVAGADAYLLESDLPVAASMLRRLAAGEAAMAAPIAEQVLRFFNESVEAPRNSPPPDDRRLDWQAHGTNPLRLSPGERRLLQLLAKGTRGAEVATRLGLSIEAIGRRTGNLYRKLSWDVRSGGLSLLAA
jgi:DNA-binding NarL/FixJ family response regulator